MKHTILGAGGSVGNALTYELLKAGEEVRLVSRSGFSIPGAISIRGDAASYEETVNNIKDSDVAYLCVGLPYRADVWTEVWPKIMHNVIDACKSANTRLVFFDNVYMYGRVHGRMTEATPYNPCSKKGEIRARIASLLEGEMEKKNITAMIARSADFYGPYATKGSIPFILAIDRVMKGKSAQWLLDGNTLHSYTYTLDCAKGLRLLSARTEGYNQVWHLPTASPPLDGKAFVDLLARELDTTPHITVLKKWMVKAAGFFNGDLSEVYEMLYQNEYDYIFDSTKFNEFFKYQPISYAAGIRDTIEFLKSRGELTP